VNKKWQEKEKAGMVIRKGMLKPAEKVAGQEAEQDVQELEVL
jgi:hypothetical protein